MATDLHFHFFEVQKPGHKIERKRLTALRTHVRRAIARKKRTQPVGYKLKILTPEDVAANKKQSKRGATGMKASTKPAVDQSQQKKNPAVQSEQQTIKRNPVLQYPVALCAEILVEMDIARLDQMFKSGGSNL